MTGNQRGTPSHGGESAVVQQYRDIIHWHEGRVDELIVAVVVLSALLLVSLTVNMVMFL